MSSSALLKGLSNFDTCNNELTQLIRKTLLDPIESSKKLTKKEIETYQRSLVPLAMNIVNQNLVSFGKLYERASNMAITSKDSDMISCLIDTSFFALKTLHVLNDTKAVKHLDVEKARSNLITKLINIKQYERALQELLLFRAHLASAIGINVDAQSSDQSEKTVLTEALNTPSTPVSPRPSKAAARQLAAELYSATNPSKHSRSQFMCLLNFPMQQNMNNVSMVRLILASQLNAIRCFVEMENGANMSELPDLMDKKGSFFDWCRHLASLDEEKAQEQFEYLYRLLSKLAKNNHSTNISPLVVLQLRVQSIIAAYFSKRAKFGYVCDQLVRIGVTFEKASNEGDELSSMNGSRIPTVILISLSVPSTVKFQNLQQHCEYILKYLEPAVDDLAGMENYFVLCEYYAYVSRKCGSYQGSFFAFKHMMRPLRIVLQDPLHCQSYHYMYAASSKMSLASLQLDKMIGSNAYTDINTTLMEVSSCIKFSIASLEKDAKLTKYSELAMRNLSKSVDNFRNSCNSMHTFLSKKMEDSIHKREVAHDPYQTPPQRKYMHADEFGDWKNNTANIQECLLRCTDLVPVCLRLLTDKNDPLTQSEPVNTNSLCLTYIDIVILLSRMTFRTADLETHERAFQYLKDGAIFCEKYDFTEGKRWLSSAYYSFGASLATEGDYGKAIVPLEKSCSILEQDQLRAKTQSEQWSMQLCKRYELLGASHLKISNEKRAISALQCALVHLPKSSIKEFVRHCDTVSLTIIIDKLPLLPKLMERYLRAAIIDRPHDEITLASETMDIGHLNTSQRAIIKECELQIMNVMSLRTNVSTLQMRLIDDLLLSYEASQYPIRRARILVEKCRLLRSQTFSHQDSNDLSQIVIDEALALLKGDVFALDTDLLDYRKYHLAAGYSWNGICKQQDIQASTNSFEMALRCWGTILKPIPLLGEDAGIDDDARSYIYRQIDGVDRLYGHLRMLSDLFAVNQRRIQRIAVLRLLLQLNNGLRDKDSDNISDAVMMCTEISGTYLELGYTGKAAAEITRAEKIMKISKCSTEAKLHHLLMYAQYLTITGDVDKSAEVYQRAKELADQANPKRHFNKYKTTQNKLTRSTLLAGASFIRSYLSVELGSVDDAVNDTTTALKILSRLSSSIFQKSKSRREQPESLDNPFQSDTKRYENTVPEEQHSHGIVHTVAEIALLDANWSMAQKMSKCFARLGALHSARGSWREAEYFYKQGLQLSEHLGSKMATSAFLISLADLYWRTGKYQESQQRLEKASELQSMDCPFPKDQATLKVVVGDIDGSQGYNDAAMESYQDADSILSNLMEHTYISELEQSIARTEQGTPRTKKLLQELTGSRTVFSDGDSEFDCVLLYSDHVNVVIREALITANTGDISMAVTELEQLEGRLPLLSNEASKLQAAISKLKLLQTLQGIENLQIGQHLKKNGISLPLLKTNTSSMPMRRTAALQTLKRPRDDIRQAIERLMDALSTGVDKLEIQLVNDVCLNLTSSLFIKSLLSTTGVFLMNETATLSTYYLELSKGISFRREMQTCLQQKLKKSSSYEDEETWPPIVPMEQTEMQDDEEMVDHWYHAHLEQLRDLYKEEHELDENGFQEKFINILPEHWTVCSLTMDPTQSNLYVTRMVANSTPIVLKLPLQRFAQRTGGGDDMSYHKVVQEFNDIINASDATMHIKKKFEDKAEIEAWWNERRALDSRLKVLMEKIEMHWFGGFKGVLGKECTIVNSKLKAFQSYLSELVCKVAHGRSVKPAISISNKPKLLEIGSDICKVILQLGIKASNECIEDLAYYLLSLYEINDIEINYADVDLGQFKDDILTGIRQYHASVQKVAQEEANNGQQNHTILILDKHTQFLPIESLSVLKNRSVSRLPCLSFLRDRILYARSCTQAKGSSGSEEQTEWTDIKLNGKSAFYVLNPSGDLKKTQAEFQSALEQRSEWQGTIGQPPMEKQIQNALRQKDIYIYFGHSGGEAFMRGHTVRQVKHCAVSLLMGCSSGLMKPVGQYDPYGYVINYMLAGCPAVVANLWDVTDKSIDRFTKSMMIRWGLLPVPGKQETSYFRGLSLTEAVMQARDDCSMPYLIGAAPVVYGIPVYLQ